MGSEIIERHKDEFTAFSTTKGTLQFTPGTTRFRSDLVELIVRERMADDRRPQGGQQSPLMGPLPPLPATIGGDCRSPG